MKKIFVMFIILFAVSFAFGLADTSGSVVIPERHKYKEINLSVFIYDRVNDSVGDTLNIELYGRNAAARTLPGVTDNGYTEWQKCYFNCVGSPDFPAPANYPAVDSIIKIELVDSAWMYIPAISTPMFTELKFVCTVQRTAARQISVKNARMYIQVDCRAEMPNPLKQSFYTSKVISSQ